MKRIAFAVMAVAIVVSSCGKKKIDLQAHRGGAGLMPENTVSAMKNSIDLGIKTLEFDLQVSGDGHVVVSHDSYFHSRYATRPDGTLIMPEDPKEYLYTMPYDSILKYDVGLRPVSRWPEQKKVAEVKPLATNLIDFIEEYSARKGFKPGYNVEIKSLAGEGEGVLWPDYVEFCDKCVDLLLSKNLGDRLIVQTFDVRSLEYIHENWPNVILSYLTDSDETDIETILGQISFKPEWWSPNYEVVTPENVAYCHKRGIKVVPWTVDDPAEIARMVSCNVDAIISNYPDRLLAVVKQ